MRLATYTRNDEKSVGFAVGDRVADIPKAAEAYGIQVGTKASFPISSLLEILRGGAEAMTFLRALEEWVNRLAPDETTSFVYPLQEVRFRAPIERPGKIIMVGLNYLGHCREWNVEVPTIPWSNGKFSSNMIGPGDPIERPYYCRQLDGEVELAIVIGEKGKYLKREETLRIVAGYTIINDVSSRDMIYAGPLGLRHFWFMKNFQTSAISGPYIVTPDEIEDIQNLDLGMDRNGKPVARGNTSDCIFQVEDLISFFSQHFTLWPGDLITTGCPPDVVPRNLGQHEFLEGGDQIRCWVEGIGALENPVATS